MKTVITYGTFDLLHQGHINLLKRAKELGDYLIVGVTSDNYDKERGKLNVRNNVMERIESVKKTGLADKIIIEDYIGQKIDDIQKYNVDVFAIGSDWKDKFDYLKEFCDVKYLTRTEGISSTILREQSANNVRIGIVGCGRIASRFLSETEVLNGLNIVGVYDINDDASKELTKGHPEIFIHNNLEDLLKSVDSVYIATPHLTHESIINASLDNNVHVLCETPLVLNGEIAKELYNKAKKKSLVLMEANKTAHCPAFNHLIVMIKSGIIGEVVDVEASLSKLWVEKKSLREFDPLQAGGSMYELGSYPLLPIVKLLGSEFESVSFYSRIKEDVDLYTKGILRYRHATASFKVGLGIKTEGNLVISGTKGYAYVSSPWWKTDYFELRYEDQNQNKKFFYKWDGAGLRYEIQEFISCILNKRMSSCKFSPSDSIFMATIMENFTKRVNFYTL